MIILMLGVNSCRWQYAQAGIALQEEQMEHKPVSMEYGGWRMEDGGWRMEDGNGHQGEHGGGEEMGDRGMGGIRHKPA